MNIIIIIPIINFIIDLLLVTLNINYNRKQKVVDNIFDEEEYTTFLEYGKEKQVNKILSLFLKLIFIITLVLFLFEFLLDLSSNIFLNETIQALFTIFVIYTVYQFIESATEMFDTYTTESKYGFNKQTKKSFFKEQLIDYIITTITIVLVSFTMIFLYNNYQNYFLIGGFALIVFLQILYHSLFVIIFIPLVYKFEPLENDELKHKIKDISKQEDFKLDDILIAKASEKTTKLNAMFSGFGKHKKVMLFDTLLNNFTSDQIISILAHEIGHYKNNDMMRDLIVEIFKSSVYFIIFYLILYSDLTIGLLSSSIYFLAALPLLYKVLKIFSNFISRYEEKKADLYTKSIGYGNELTESLSIVAKANMSNLYPHPLFTFFKADHPTYLQRVEYLK